MERLFLEELTGMAFTHVREGDIRGEQTIKYLQAKTSEQGIETDDVVVIFAGYPQKMERLLRRNPGLQSRIPFHLSFPDYSEEELFQILINMAEAIQYDFAPGVENAVFPLLHKARAMPDFGNGRFVRNLLERARMNHAERVLHSTASVLSSELLSTLYPEDFEAIDLQLSGLAEKTPLGFTP